MAEDLWRDVAATYDRSFATLCAGTTAAVLECLPSGAAVLDVGCGTGLLAAALDSAGHAVTAIDPDPEMVELARTRTDASLVVGALPDLPVLDSSVEVAVANFVLNHVDDPRAAARGLRRVVRPGGRVVATSWPGSPPPQARMWGQVLDAAGAVRPELPRLPVHLDFERTADGLAGVLADAGLEPVTSVTTGWEWRVDPDDLWAGLTAVGNFGVTWRDQDADVRARMRSSYDDVQQPWRDGDVLCFPVECILAEAVRPQR